jgi:tetratricopeptide (TPR) repeat protein
LALFTVAAVMGFAWINGLFVYRGDGRAALAWGAGIALVLAIAGTWAELYWRTRPERVEEEEGIRKRLIREGTTAYLRQEDTVALESFRECLRLFPQDVEALFRLGVISSRIGDVRSARRWLRRTLRYDIHEKWRWEIENTLKALSGNRRNAAPSRDGAAASPREGDSDSSKEGDRVSSKEGNKASGASRVEQKEEEDAEHASA